MRKYPDSGSKQIFIINLADSNQPILLPDVRSSDWDEEGTFHIEQHNHKNMKVDMNTLQIHQPSLRVRPT